MQMEVSGRSVSVFPGDSPDAPLVVLNTFESEGEEVFRAVKSITDADFSLVSVGDLDWNADMSPWEAPGLGRNDLPFPGGADAYLRKLVEEVLPAAEGSASLQPSVRMLAGYSLAGLFALYSMYSDTPFTRFASMSGSLWYPGFAEFASSRTPRAERVYLSLGDREPKTRHPVMAKVGECTESMYGLLKSQGVEAEFEWNPGNHFSDPVGRTARGIARLLRAPRSRAVSFIRYPRCTQHV